MTVEDLLIFGKSHCHSDHAKILLAEIIEKNPLELLTCLQETVPIEKIELSNYSSIIKIPLIIYHNLYFDADSSKIAKEINFTKKYNCILICDSTNQRFHQNKSLLKEVQNICKINICFGQTLDYQKAKLILILFVNSIITFTTCGYVKTRFNTTVIN